MDDFAVPRSVREETKPEGGGSLGRPEEERRVVDEEGGGSASSRVRQPAHHCDRVETSH